MKAHIGGNQVTGFVSSTTSRSAGTREEFREIVDSGIEESYAGSPIVSNYMDNKNVHITDSDMPQSSVFIGQISKAVAVQF
jgi:hypothetical protein